MIKLLNIIFHWTKQLFLSTLYGIRQCIFQTICWILFEFVVNIFGISLWRIYEGALRICVYECLWGYTMMYYWVSMFINEKRSAVRFFVPYILYTAFASYWVMIKHGVSVLFLYLALAIPFTCPLFFLLENKLKQALAPHK